MNYIGVVSLLVDGVDGSNTIVIVSCIEVDASQKLRTGRKDLGIIFKLPAVIFTGRKEN